MKKNVHTAGKSRKQKKIMLLLLELLIILLLAIALFITTKLSKIEKNKLDMNDVSINDDLSDETKEAMAHYKTIALFGLDNRSNGSLSKGNSDVIMLANIDTKQHTINLVSVYRDSYLDTGNGTYQKCNAAYAKGGPEQALSMLNTNLDLAITDYVTVDFNAIIECVDLLGGVDITITDDEASLMIGYMKELNELTGHNSTPPASGGTYTLDGVQACAYARIRYGGGDDYRRTERQRTVLTAMMQKAQKSNILTLNKLINAAFGTFRPVFPTRISLPLPQKFSVMTLEIQPVFHMKKQRTNMIRSAMLSFRAILLLTLHNYISFYLMMKIIPHLQQFFQTASRSSLIQDINRETAIKAVSLFCQLISQFIYFFPDGVHLSGHILYGLLYLSFPSFYQQSPL